MKYRISGEWRSLGLVLCWLPLAAGCVQEASSLPEEQAGIIKADTGYQTVAQTDLEEPAPQAENPGEDISDAAVKPFSNESSVPTNIRPGSPLAEMLKLADSGVDESVLMSFVNNSTGTFNLGADQIIYLNDIGVPPAVVTAMMQRDHILKGRYTESEFASGASQPANAATSATTPVPEEPAPATAGAGPAEPPVNYATADYAVAAPAAYAGFYDSLAPYGTWVTVDGYGVCWQPTAVVIDPGWRPYCDRGCWVYSDCGWYWYSDYSWGWAPFHYGRWFRHHQLGWCWYPDRVWGPSWVSWRYSNDYCGWAPLPPRACYQPGFGFTYFGRSVGFSFNFGLGAGCYTFVPFRNFGDHHLHAHALGHDQALQVFHHTTESTRVTSRGSRLVNVGIPVERVASATRTAVQQVAIRETALPLSRGERAERLEGNGRTVSVARLQAGSDGQAFRPPAAGAPARHERERGTFSAARTQEAGQPRSGLHNATVAPGSSAQTIVESHPGQDRQVQAGRDARSGETRRSTFGPTAPGHRESISGPQASISREREARAANGRGSPIIIRGPQNSAQAGEGTTIREPAPRNSLIVIGNKDANRTRTATDGERASPPRLLAERDTAPTPSIPQPAPAPWFAPRSSDAPARFEQRQPVYRPETPGFQRTMNEPRQFSMPNHQGFSHSSSPERAYSVPSGGSHAVHSSPGPSAPSAPASKNFPSADRRPR